ncbi:hypothetical protein J7L87_00550 [bacterium]|nr:hypothetical protein [bacterium]
MKAVFIGGGAHRHLPIIRSALGFGVFDDGEIFLYDLREDRAEAMARMIEKTPEYRKHKCKISYKGTLEEALDGADFVSVVLLAGSLYSFIAGENVSLEYGFLASDNITLNGAFLALKGAPIIMEIAKKMEKYCPDAILIDFANPVAVLSGAVNKYTKIKALGVCHGYMNHCWDLTRIMGKDEFCGDYEVKVAGINHFSFIIEGKYKGKDLKKLIEYYIKRKTWKKLKLRKYWSKITKKNIKRGLGYMVKLFEEFDALLFSNEGDGIGHFFYEDYLNYAKKNWKKKTKSEIKREVKERIKAKEKADKEFREILKKDLDENFWNTYPLKNRNFGRDDKDIIAKILRAVSGKKEKIVASRPNEGAVEGMENRLILEYSMEMKGKEIKPEKSLKIPESMYGIISSLSNYQTLLADAIGTKDPKILYQALYSYPVKQGSKEAKRLWKELLEINKDEIYPEFLKLEEFIK